MTFSDPTDIMRQPYERVLIPEKEGGYSAYIAEFEGCVAEGETAEEALHNLELTALAWVEAELESGREIPEARNLQEYSGKLLLRLPKSLHGRLVRQASHEGVSLNQYVVYRLSFGSSGTQIGRSLEAPPKEQRSLVVKALKSVSVARGTMSMGREARTGRFVPVAESRNRRSTTIVERVPKPGAGKSKRTYK